MCKISSHSHARENDETERREGDEESPGGRGPSDDRQKARYSALSVGHPTVRDLRATPHLLPSARSRHSHARENDLIFYTSFAIKSCSYQRCANHTVIF